MRWLLSSVIISFCSCSEKSILSSDEESDKVEMSLCVDDDILALYRLKEVCLRTNDTNETIRLDITFCIDDANRVRDFTEDKTSKMMKVKLNGISITQGALLTTISSSVSAIPIVNITDSEIALLQSLLVEGEVTKLHYSEVRPEGGIIEAMEGMFSH